MPNPTHASIYAQVTSRIVSALEHGVIPWRKPWRTGEPVNAVSTRPYRGVNVLLLELTALERGFTSNGWITYQAARNCGGHVRKGEKATAVVWWDKRPKRRSDPDDREITGEQKNDTTEYVWWMRTCSVFSLDQCEGLEALRARLSECRSAIRPIDDCERLVAESGAEISHAGSAAFYNSHTDSITIPPLQRFVSLEAYYATLFHELTHWTGASHRLNRQFGERFADARYAMEELVAELGAAFVSSRFGFEHVSQAASYIDSWMRVLRTDNRAVFTAARFATQAADYLSPVFDAYPEDPCAMTTAPSTHLD